MLGVAGLREPYGRFTLGRASSFGSHRISYTIANGDPGNFHVCHSCDNPPCVNPKHLWKGTAKQNSGDMVAKDRHPRGERKGCSKLTEEQVRERTR